MCGASRWTRDAASKRMDCFAALAMALRVRVTPSTSLRANGSRECAPDDRLREAIHLSACHGHGLLRFARNDAEGPQRTESPILWAGGRNVAFCGAAKLSQWHPSNGQWQFGWLVYIGASGMQASEPRARSEGRTGGY